MDRDRPLHAESSAQPVPTPGSAAESLLARARDRGPTPGHLDRRFFAVGAVLVVLIWVVYARTATFDFVNFDDERYVSENPVVQQGLTLAGVKWAFAGTHVSNWHPLTWLSHMLDCQLFGLDVGLHHLTSVALHSLNAVLLLLFLLLATGKLWSSAFAAAFFALHPLRVESVAWISERKDVLSGMFWMLTLLAWRRYSRKESAFSYLLVVVLLALGLMAKPMLVTMPFVLLLVDVWPLRRWRFSTGTSSNGPVRPRHGLGRLLLEKIPLIALAGASMWITVLAQGSALAGEGMPLATRVINAPLACVAYLRKTVWPVDLACFYPHPALVTPELESLRAHDALIAGFALLAVSVAAVVAARRAPCLFAGWFWFLGSLVPVLGIVQVGRQSLADRYTYLPLIGITMVVAFGVSDALRRWWPGGGRVALAAAATLVMACLPITWRQVGVWRNGTTLWQHALEVTDHNFVAHYNLGTLLESQGKNPEAMIQYQRTIESFPRHVKAHNNLGILLGKAGKMQAAIQHFQEALRQDPDFAEAHANLGMALSRIGNAQGAMLHLQRAIQLLENSAAGGSSGADDSEIGALVARTKELARRLGGGR